MSNTIIDGKEVTMGEAPRVITKNPSGPKIVVGGYELRQKDLENLIAFVQNGKLDEIMKS